MGHVVLVTEFSPLRSVERIETFRPNAGSVAHVGFSPLDEWEAAQVLSDYRRLRHLKSKPGQEAGGKASELVRQAWEKDAKRLEELHERISVLEKGMQPQRTNSYVWLLRRMN